MRHIATRLSALFAVGALIAAIIAGCGTNPAPPPPPPNIVAPNWNLYGNANAYYVVPYANPTPAFGSQTGLSDGLHADIEVCDNDHHCTATLTPRLDTGSRGLWVSAQAFPSAVPTALSTPGYIFYNSSGLQIQGNWTELSVTFLDAQSQSGAPIPAVATVPVLLATQNCLIPGSWPEQTNPSPEACSTPGAQEAFMGIGFDRTGYGTCPEGLPTPGPNVNPNVPSCAEYLAPSPVPAANQNYNPLLNLAAMQAGLMNSGYILTQGGLLLGLTKANTKPVPGLGSGATYAYEKLVPTGLSQIANSPPDWQPATGTIAINNVTNPFGQAVVDIGISDMLVGPASPIPSETPVPGGSDASVTLLGLPAGTVGYSFVVGDTSNPLAPAPSSDSPTGANYSPYQQIAYPGNAGLFAFLNTGIDALNGFNYLYDAENGYIGLQLNTKGTTAFLTPSIGANGTISVPDGFVTNLPMNLLTNTTISTGGKATFNGPLTGAGTLTVMGGTVSLNCANVLSLTTVTQGTLIIGGSISGTVKTSGTGIVKKSSNDNCGTLSP